jgi:hypothetical protein
MMKESIELQSPSGIPLILVPYKLVNNIVYYEIKAKEGELTNNDKQEILGHLTKARPDLMAKWHEELKGRVNLGRNILGLTNDKRLLIEENDIKTFVFSFDPNRNSAIKKLGLSLIKACHLPPTLSFGVKNETLIFAGDGLNSDISQRLQRFMLDVVKSQILVLENVPTELTEQDMNIRSVFDLARANLYLTAVELGGSNKVILGKHYVSLPLSSLNILLRHFNIPYRFDYLGDKVENSESMRVYTEGLRLYFSRDKSCMETFYRTISDGERILDVSGLREMLNEKDSKICRHPVPEAILPISNRPKL